MGSNNHNDRCAKASGHVCRCTGCGGSLHGWLGWIELAQGPQSKRDALYQSCQQALVRTKRTNKVPRNQRSREARTDLARLDVASWLVAPAQTPTDGPALLDQLVPLANSMTTGTWPEVMRHLPDLTPTPKQIQFELTSHFWCDLFLSMAQAVELGSELRQELDESTRNQVVDIISGSSACSTRPGVTRHITSMVVGLVWAASRSALLSNLPLFDLMTRPAVARALRILASFICPCPEKHPELRSQGLKLLAEESGPIITQRSRDHLAEIYEEWQEERPID